MIWGKRLAFGARRPAWAIVLSLFVCVAFGVGISQLSINADTRVFFSPDNVQRQTLDQFEARYAEQNNVFLTFHAKEGSIFTPERLGYLRTMTELAWKLPYATRVDSVTNAVHIRSSADELIIEDMVSTDAFETATSLAAHEAEARSAQVNILDDNLLVGRLIAADGKTSAININFQYPRGSTDAPGEIIGAIETLAWRIPTELGGP